MTGWARDLSRIAGLPRSIRHVRELWLGVGAGAAFDLGLLAQKGSLYATRPSLFTHIADRRVYEDMTEDLERAIKRGHLNLDVAASFPLEEAAKVHAALEARQTVGSIVLTP